MSVRVEHADMLSAIPRLVAEGVVCDACVTDPPYHLLPTQKRFGAIKSAPAQRGRDGAMARLSGGFMGQRWDGGDIAFRPETWATVATILRPGAFLIAFGGCRTYHRLVCAIEDAGFVIQDQIAWMFATGFPKRRDMLKPAYEPIVLAYKPGGKRLLQVDECRIATDWSTDPTRRGWQGATTDSGQFGWKNGKATGPKDTGRWPANVAHDGSDEVVECFPQSAGQQSGVRGTEPSNKLGRIIYSNGLDRTPFPARSGAGSAARFFFSAKAGSEDRWGSRHPTVKPVELMKWLIALVTPPGGTVIDPFAGSGTSGAAAFATGRNAILIEREDQYIADIKERMAFYEGGGAHSAVAKNRNRGNDVDGGRGRPVSDIGTLFDRIGDAAE